MKHLGFCRKHMESIAPNYGSECTCGFEWMLTYVKEKWDDGPEAVAEFLNWQLQWQEHPERKIERRELERAQDGPADHPDETRWL